MSTTNFQNISVSGSVVSSDVTCDTLNTNILQINTTDINLGGSLFVNSISPFSGNIINIQSNKDITLNTSNVNITGNSIISGTLFTKNINAGTSNINAGNIILSGGLDIIGSINLGNIYQSYTINSPINSTIHTTYIEPSIDNTSDFVLIKAESPNTGFVALYGQNVISYANVLCDRGISIGNGINGSKLSAYKSSDLYGNTSILGNLIINSDANISNQLTTRSGFKGAVATNKFVTYDIPGIGTHYFNDSIEIVNALVVGGSISGGSITGTGNISGGNIITTGLMSASRISTGNIDTGNINLNTGNLICPLNNNQVIFYNNLYKKEIRCLDIFGAIGGTAPASIASNGFVLFDNPLYGTYDEKTTTAFRINKGGASLTVGVCIQLVWEMSLAVTNTTIGDFGAQVSLTGGSAFTTLSNKTVSRVTGTFANSSSHEMTIMFNLNTTEEWFRIRYVGNVAWTYAVATSGFTSRYNIRTYI